MAKMMKVKIKNLETLIETADANRAAIKDTDNVWYETSKKLAMVLIAQAKKTGKKSVEVPVYAYNFIDAMTRDIEVKSDLATNADDFHPKVEKVLRRYTKNTKWHKELKISDLEKAEFALMLAYMIEKDLYCHEINKKRRKELEKRYRDKYLHEVFYEEATDWACRKGYCEDRVSDMITGYIDTISPNCDDILKKKKKGKKAA